MEESQQTGMFSEHYESGALRRTYFLRYGRKVGIDTMYNEDGTVFSKVIYSGFDIDKVIYPQTGDEQPCKPTN